jgi:hypothetical protein
MGSFWEDQKKNAEVIPPAGTQASVGAVNQLSTTAAPDFKTGATEVIPAPQQQPDFFKGITPMGTMGAITRGAAPYAAAAGVGAAMGAPFAGVGALPGAVAGIGLMGLAQMLGEPLVAAWNIAFPHMPVQTPTEAMQGLLTSIGVSQAQSGIERTLQAGSAGVAGALGMTGLGQTMVKYGSDAVKGIGSALATDPAVKVLGKIPVSAGMVSGALGGAAGQTAAEAGLPPLAQAAAGFGGGLLGSIPGGLSASARVRPASFNPTEGFVPNASMTDVGALVAQAAGNGPTATAARVRLAAEAKINPEAYAAAQKLGFTLPPETFSDSRQVQTATGLNRSIKTSQAAEDWHTAFTDAQKHADSVMENTGAIYVNGGPSMDVASQQVKEALTTTKDGLQKSASDLYNRVREAVPLTTRSSTENIRDYLDSRVNDLGGIKNDEGYNQLSAPEKRVFNMVYAKDAKGNWQPVNPTYGALQDTKQLIGKQAYSGSDPFPDATDAIKKQLYGVISKDQTHTIEQVADPETMDIMHAANDLWAKNKAMEDSLVTLFGNDQANGSLAAKLQSALVSGGKKGDSGAFMRVFQAIPDDLKKPVMATALASVTRAAGAVNQGFGSVQYDKLFNQLSSNPTVYKAIADSVGPEGEAVLRSLGTVSHYININNAQISHTGASMQAYLKGINPDNLLSELLGKGTKVAATTVGATVLSGFGPVGTGVGAAAGSVLAEFLANGSKKTLETAAALFRDPKFQSMLSNPEQAAAVASSPAYQAYAKYAGLPREVRGAITFLKGALIGADVATYQTTGPMSALEQNRAKNKTSVTPGGN